LVDVNVRERQHSNMEEHDVSVRTNNLTGQFKFTKFRCQVLIKICTGKCRSFLTVNYCISLGTPPSVEIGSRLCVGSVVVGAFIYTT
jgi:hypothetical protein